jgi:carboxylesterase type B
MMSTKRFIVQAAVIVLVLFSEGALSQAQRAGDTAAAASPPALDGPIVKLGKGRVQGFVADGVAVFRAVPFAAPPVGDLRWRAPKPAAKWPDVRPGNVFSATCAQAAPAAQRATMFGLPHGGEIAYVFNTPRATAFDEEGKAVASAANRYWAQFAKTGDPDSAAEPNWPKFDLADEYVMEFPADGIPVAAKHFHKSRLDWVEASLPTK